MDHSIFEEMSVHYKSLDSALLAYNSMNGRYFAGKQITCEFVAVTRWKAAICGEYMRSRFKTCSHGVACNFIHCFRNPGGDYEWADWDNPPPKYWTRKMAALFGPPDDSVFSKASDTPGFEWSHSSDRERLRSSDDSRYLSSRSRDGDAHCHVRPDVYASPAAPSESCGSTGFQSYANIPGTMQSQSIMPQMQFGLTAGHPQRSHPSQMMTDQMFGMGATNTTSMMGMQQQQQQQQQGVYGNMQGGAQNMQQQGMVGLQNQQNHMQNPNFPQQRQQNQQMIQTH